MATTPPATVLSRKQVVDAARAQGVDAKDRDFERMLGDRLFKPEPEKSGDRYVYVAAHVEQLVAFVKTIRRRVSA